MIKEVAHFLYYAPGTLALKIRMEQVDLFEILMTRLDKAGMAEKRAALVGDIGGNVLEIGCGTGRMFAHYGSNVEVTAIDPTPSFLQRAQVVARQSRAHILLVTGSGLSLPFGTAIFDAVVIALVLCSVPSVGEILAEVKRVMKPGGQLRLIEHGRSDRLVAGFLMDALNPLWRKANGQGCNMNRNPVRSLREAGFFLLDVRPFHLFCSGLPAFPHQLIKATR